MSIVPSTSGVPAFKIDQELCARYIVKQEHSHPGRALLVIKGDEWAYLPRSKWPEGTFYDRLDEAMDEDDGNHYFCVVENTTTNTMDVFTIDKTLAASIVLSTATA